jgi:hypothetical protein
MCYVMLCYVNSLTFHYSFYLYISRHNTFQVLLKTDDLSLFTSQSFLNQLRWNYPNTTRQLALLRPAVRHACWNRQNQLHEVVQVCWLTCFVLYWIKVSGHMGTKLKALSVHASSVRRSESYGWSGLASDEYLRGRVKFHIEIEITL